MDTADIIRMNYTEGGRITPIWNSDRVNYYLIYDSVTSTVDLTPYQRPEEEDRGEIEIRVTKVERLADGTERRVIVDTGTVIDKGTINDEKYTVTLPDVGGKLEVLFISRVTAEDGSITTKEYMVTIYKDFNSAEPDIRDETQIKVLNMSGREYTLTPTFNVDFTSYFVQVPNSVTSVIMWVDSGYKYVDSNGIEHEGGHTVYVNGRLRRLQGDHRPLETRIDNLVVGDNTIPVEIVDAGGNRKVYNVVINRMDAESMEEATVVRKWNSFPCLSLTCASTTWSSPTK